MNKEGNEHHRFQEELTKKNVLFNGFSKIKDTLFPSARRFDIEVDTVEHIERAVTMLKSIGVDTEPKKLRQILEAFNESLSWLAKEYDYPERPILSVVKRSRRQKKIANFAYSIPYDIIMIDTDTFSPFTGKPLDKPYPLIQDEVEEMKLTLLQYAESSIIEEGTHFLAARGIGGLAPLPKSAPKEPSVIRYHKIPHEKDALMASHKFFFKKYGASPLAPLVHAVKS